MDANELDVRAQARYAADDNQVKPTWEQIGDTTKSVWRDYVLADLAKPVAEIAAPSAPSAAFSIPSLSLPVDAQSVEADNLPPDEPALEPERQRECGQMGLF